MQVTGNLKDAIIMLRQLVDADNPEDLLNALKDSTYRDFDLKTGQMINKTKMGLMRRIELAIEE